MRKHDRAQSCHRPPQAARRALVHWAATRLLLGGGLPALAPSTSARVAAAALSRMPRRMAVARCAASCTDRWRRAAATSTALRLVYNGGWWVVGGGWRVAGDRQWAAGGRVAHATGDGALVRYFVRRCRDAAMP